MTVYRGSRDSDRKPVTVFSVIETVTRWWAMTKIRARILRLQLSNTRLRTKNYIRYMRNCHKIYLRWEFQGGYEEPGVYTMYFTPRKKS